MGAVSAQTGSILHSEQDGGTLIKDISMLLSHREKTTFNGIIEVWDTIGVSRSPRPFSIPPGTEWWITPCATCLWSALKGRRRLGTSKRSMSIHFTGLHWAVKDSQCYGILLGTWELKLFVPYLYFFLHYSTPYFLTCISVSILVLNTGHC